MHAPALACLVVTIVRPAPLAIDPGRSAVTVLLVHSAVFGSFGALQLKQLVSVTHIAESITLKLVA